MDIFSLAHVIFFPTALNPLFPTWQNFLPTDFCKKEKKCQRQYLSDEEGDGAGGGGGDGPPVGYVQQRVENHAKKEPKLINYSLLMNGFNIIGLWDFF